MTTSQPASPTVERLREDQITAAAGVLARAFQNDPPVAYGIPNPAERARILPTFMKPFVTFASLFGEAYVTTGKLESVAIWLPLDNLDERPEQNHQAGIDTIPSIVGREASARFMNIIRFVEAFHQRFAADRHLYLQWLGGNSAAAALFSIGHRSTLPATAVRVPDTARQAVGKLPVRTLD